MCRRRLVRDGKRLISLVRRASILLCDHLEELRKLLAARLGKCEIVSNVGMDSGSLLKSLGVGLH